MPKMVRMEHHSSLRSATLWACRRHHYQRREHHSIASLANHSPGKPIVCKDGSAPSPDSPGTAEIPGWGRFTPVSRSPVRR